MITIMCFTQLAIIVWLRAPNPGVISRSPWVTYYIIITIIMVTNTPNLKAISQYLIVVIKT